MKQIYIPIAEYEHEYRYSNYLAFLIRLIYKDVRYTKVYKKEFIDNGFKQWIATRRNLKNIWEKGAYTNKFLNVQKKARNCLSLVGSKNFKIVRVSQLTYKKIKTISDYKDFITCVVAGYKSKCNKGRGYWNIAGKTWTNYKETACRRIKRGITKFWLTKINRYWIYNGNLVRITNSYKFEWIVYIKGFKNSPRINITNTKKSITESIFKPIVKWISLILPFLPTDMYSIFNKLAYKV